eukprot:scaffold447_cov307-Pinguiococcus_pyrenoidosus.AAC.10
MQLRAELASVDKTANDRIETLEHECNARAEELKEAADEKSAAMREVHELRAQARELVVKESVLMEKEAEVEELRADLASLEGKINALEQQCHAKSQELEEATKEKTALRKELQQFTIVAEEMEKHRTLALDRQAELSELRDEMARQESAADSQIQALERECADHANVSEVVRSELVPREVFVRRQHSYTSALGTEARRGRESCATERAARITRAGTGSCRAGSSAGGEGRRDLRAAIGDCQQRSNCNVSHRSSGAEKLQETAQEKADLLGELRALRARAEELASQEAQVVEKEFQIQDLQTQLAEHESNANAKIAALEEKCSATAEVREGIACGRANASFISPTVATSGASGRCRRTVWAAERIGNPAGASSGPDRSQTARLLRKRSRESRSRSLTRSAPPVHRFVPAERDRGGRPGSWSDPLRAGAGKGVARQRSAAERKRELRI